MKNQNRKIAYNILNEEGPEYKDYNEYTPKINAWEVKEYEDQFKEKVYHDVQFDKQGEGENAYSMKFYKGDSGVEAVWSGDILLPGENKIKWKFSLQTPPVVEANVQLDATSSEVLKKLYDYYDIWRNEWSKMLTIPQKSEEMPGEQSEVGMDAGTPMDMAAGTEMPPLQESLIMRKRSVSGGRMTTKQQIRDGANEIVKNHGDRMRRLAGLK